MFLDQRLIRIVITMCCDADSPRALTVKILLEHGELDQLFSLRVDPLHYSCPENYFRDCQVTEFIRKLNIPGDRSQKLESDARSAFFANERRCAETNARLSRYIENGPFESPSDIRVLEVISWMRKRLDNILGYLPRELDIRFGPGATYRDRGRLTTIPDKISNRPTVTSSATCLLPFFWDSAWGRSVTSDGSSPSIVPGNRFTTVPKDATKRRGICIEPSVNVSFQLSVGQHIRARLKRVGIDLLEGQQVHRNIARSASRDGSHATIDLSNASDNVCINLVKLLLPSDWFSLLSSLRSSITVVDGKRCHLHKFSSMGNGFTFELETLLFLVICEASLYFGGYECWDIDRYVYGDDIIVPNGLASNVVSALAFFGFSPNERKTFVSGYFRESCGGDYFKGVAVRPHYLKEIPNEPQEIIALINGLKRVSDSFSDPRRNFLYRARLRCLDLLPSQLRRLRGPESLGDLVIHDRNWSFRETSDKRGFVRGYCPVGTPLGWSHWRPGVILASALYGVPGEGPLPRAGVSGYRLKWISVLEREIAA